MHNPKWSIQPNNVGAGDNAPKDDGSMSDLMCSLSDRLKMIFGTQAERFAAENCLKRHEANERSRAILNSPEIKNLKINQHIALNLEGNQVVDSAGSIGRK